MFIGLSKQLKEGETVPVKLKFEKSGEVEVPFHVKDIRPAHGDLGHDH
jgi:copper(I)-binding protein